MNRMDGIEVSYVSYDSGCSRQDSKPMSRLTQVKGSES